MNNKIINNRLDTCRRYSESFKKNVVRQVEIGSHPFMFHSSPAKLYLKQQIHF